MKKYNSKLHKEIEKKKELAEAEDYVKQIDQSPNETARKFVVDQVKEEEKREIDVADTVKSVLESKKNTQHISYRSDLAKYGNWLLEEIREDKWELEFVPTDGTRIKIYGRWFPTQEGIQLIVKSPLGHVYARGIKTSYVPDWDEAGIKTLYVQAENTMDAYKGLLLSEK